jgi:hypothetical protein
MKNKKNISVESTAGSGLCPRTSTIHEIVSILFTPDRIKIEIA